MDASDALAWCQFGCGRHVHAKCMRVWGQHQMSQKQPITCPLCREEWGSATLEALYQQVHLMEHVCCIWCQDECVVHGMSCTIMCVSCVHMSCVDVSCHV